jgi:hypothetical protein
VGIQDAEKLGVRRLEPEHLMNWTISLNSNPTLSLRDAYVLSDKVKRAIRVWWVTNPFPWDRGRGARGPRNGHPK